MRKIFLMIVACAALAACASPNQKLLDADTAYGITQDRALRYEALPVTDPAAKQAIKDTVAANAGASGDSAVNAANAALMKTLADHKINCGAGAADTCP